MKSFSHIWTGDVHLNVPPPLFRSLRVTVQITGIDLFLFFRLRHLPTARVELDVKNAYCLRQIVWKSSGVENRSEIWSQHGPIMDGKYSDLDDQRDILYHGACWKLWSDDHSLWMGLLTSSMMLDEIRNRLRILTLASRIKYISASKVKKPICFVTSHLLPNVKGH